MVASCSAWRRPACLNDELRDLSDCCERQPTQPQDELFAAIATKIIEFAGMDSKASCCPKNTLQASLMLGALLSQILAGEDLDGHGPFRADEHHREASNRSLRIGVAVLPMKASTPDS